MPLCIIEHDKLYEWQNNRNKITLTLSSQLVYNCNNRVRLSLLIYFAGGSSTSCATPIEQENKKAVPSV